MNAVLCERYTPLYKVLLPDMKTPYQGFRYKQGETYTCNDFDANPNNDCSCGFYAVDIDGLPYAYSIHRKVFRCEVWGRAVEIDEFKRRYEHIVIGDEVSRSELVELAKPWNETVGYRLSDVLNPINPITISPPEITDEHLLLLKQWDSVRDSVGASVWAAVRDSVGASVGNSVWDSVWDSVWASVRAAVRDSVGASVGNSVWDSVWDSVRAAVGASVRASVGNSVWDSVWDSVGASVGAYIGSLFTNIPTWSYVTHERGVYPFQPAVDLWKQGLVPSYNGEVWRLHGGEKASVLWEGEIR